VGKQPVIAIDQRDLKSMVSLFRVLRRIEVCPDKLKSFRYGSYGLPNHEITLDLGTPDCTKSYVWRKSNDG
jgi:hypothetical protein